MKQYEDLKNCLTSIKENTYIKQILSNILSIGNILNAGKAAKE